MVFFFRVRVQLRDEDFCRVFIFLNIGIFGIRKVYSRLAILDFFFVGEERGFQKYVFQFLNGKGILIMFWSFCYGLGFLLGLGLVQWREDRVGVYLLFFFFTVYSLVCLYLKVGCRWVFGGQVKQGGEFQGWESIVFFVVEKWGEVVKRIVEGLGVLFLWCRSVGGLLFFKDVFVYVIIFFENFRGV